MQDLQYMIPLRINVDQHQSVTVDGIPGVQVDQVDAAVSLDGHPVRDVLAELGIEKSWAVLEQMAKPRDFSWRRVKFVVADESPTLLPGQWRQRPQAYTYPPSGLPLTFCHTHLVIGVCQRIWLAGPDELAGVEGTCLLGDALLYDSNLADAAWRGMAQGLFTGVCPVALRPCTDPPGAGQIMAIGLAEVPWCRNAKIIRTWDWRDEMLAQEA